MVWLTVNFINLCRNSRTSIKLTFANNSRVRTIPLSFNSANNVHGDNRIVEIMQSNYGGVSGIN